MTWFYVDDNLDGHPKADGTSNAALGLWVRCGALCARNGTEGFITAAQARRRGTQGQIAELVRIDWWVKVDGGYQMQDWAQWQRTTTETAERKAEKARQRAEAGRRGGLKSGQARRSKAEADASFASEQNEASASKQTPKQPKQNEPPPLGSSVLRTSEPPTPPLPTTSASSSPNDLAGEITQAWYDGFEPRPTQPFIAARKIAETLVKAGWPADRVLAEMRSCGSTVVRARVEDRLRGLSRNGTPTTDQRFAEGRSVAAELREAGL